MGKVYPDAGEGVVWLCRPANASSGGAPQPGDDHAARSARRARSRLRRYAVTNRLTRLWSLTTADQTTDRALMVRRVQAFIRRLEGRYPEVVWVWTLERHKSGALHVHMLASAWVPKPAVASLWGHGWVDLREIRAKGSRPARSSARMAASYIAKYVSKAPVAGPGQHRYEVRQGYQGGAVVVRADRPSDALAMLAELMGAEPSSVRTSEGWTDYNGPPVALVEWA